MTRVLTAIVFFLCLSARVAQSRPTTPTAHGDIDVLQPRESNGSWGFVNAEGAFVIRPKYFSAGPFKDGLALVVTRKPRIPFGSEAGESGLAQITYIDREGRGILPPLSVRWAGNFSEGLAAVVPDEVLRMMGGCAKGGYINTKGEWAIKPQFDGVTGLSEGLAAVNMGATCGMGGKWGYIDKDGQAVISFKFVWAGQFHGGRAAVAEKVGQCELVDQKGSVIPNEKCR